MWLGISWKRMTKYAKNNQIFEKNLLRRQFSSILHDWVKIVCIRVNLDPKMYVYGSILTNICMYMGGFETKSLTMHGWVYTSPVSSFVSAYISSTPPPGFSWKLEVVSSKRLSAGIVWFDYFYPNVKNAQNDFFGQKIVPHFFFIIMKEIIKPYWRTFWLSSP